MAQSLFRSSIPPPLLALLDADEVVDGKNHRVKANKSRIMLAMDIFLYINVYFIHLYI